ncbi:hypothetical protein MF628_004087 [Paenibacillus polymyxa]|uniref:hypothetical protein n=1 Tax=Paenibacillus polymyxa TaxID=1406 RepID=UPI002024C1BC|nr:hypothetical protein [Paenibacillus polymyxa]URJ44371.1 hypothetical protein MF628_004087 [Paenibacillus polymyxa]
MSDLLGALVFEMDGVMGSINSSLEVMSDLEVRLGQLRVDLDTAVYRGEERIFNRDHHREVRILSELFHYLMMDLKAASETALNLHLSIFDTVAKK